jgi:hypothetical protein
MYVGEIGPKPASPIRPHGLREDRPCEGKGKEFKLNQPIGNVNGLRTLMVYVFRLVFGFFFVVIF